MRMMLGKFEVLDIEMDYIHQIPVWLEIRNYGDTHVLRGFFTDYYRSQRELSVILANLLVFPIDMYDHRKQYYNKWIIFEVYPPDWDKLEMYLKSLWSFKAKSKYFRVKFAPAYSSPKKIVNGIALELGV